MKDKVIDHPGRRAGQAPGLLRRIHQTARGFVLPLLDDLLLEIDDELFQRAEGAMNDRLQQEYFDAMRTLRLEREPLQTRFQNALDQGGSSDSSGTSQVGKGGFAERIANLSLLDNEALEQRLSVTTMSHRLDRECELELSLLARRIEALTERDSACAAIPASWRPRHFAGAFASALEGMELASEVRLVLFKIFEHRVLAKTTGLYPQLNDFLSQAGVLPDLSPGDVRPVIRNARESNSAQAAPTGTPMDARRGEATTAEAGAGTDAHSRHSITKPSPKSADPRMRTDEARRIVASLPGLGHHRRYSAADAGAGERMQAAPAGQLVQVSGITQRRLLSKLVACGLDTLPARIDLAAALIADMDGAGIEPTLAAPEEDVVNLVQMLFDAVLRDDDLAVPMRALLARLQLPLLRVALADTAFLTDGEHHVRQFLNHLIDAGTGWARADERAQDRLYRIIEAIVDRLAEAEASEFEGDATLIRELDDDLRAALEQETRALQRVQERVVAQERARIRAEHTRQLVARLIDHRAAMVEDEVLRSFLREEWQLVMLRAHQEGAGHSEAWKSAFATLRSLTGAAGTDRTAMHAAMCAGLERIKDPAEAERTASMILDRLADKEAATPDRAGAATAAPLATLPAPAVVSSSRSNIEQLPDRAAVERADALCQGDWLELHVDAERVARCRLAAVTEPPERCIFLNRRGVRIETLSRLELARALESGRARPLDTHQLFDTALETVIGSLRTANATA